MNMKRFAMPSLLAVAVVAMSFSYDASAQQPPQDRRGLRQPVYRVAQAQPAPVRQATAQQPVRNEQPQAQQEEHPLAPMVARANELIKHMDENVQDYSATLVKRERVDGVLNGHQYIYTKIRHEQKNERGAVVEPFSVYMNFQAPDEVKGREVIYVEGENGGNLIAHDGGVGLLAQLKASVTVSLDPESPRAMKGNKYPITSVGMKNLMKKLIVVATESMKHDECEVKLFPKVKVNGRVCTCMQSVHPVPRDHFKFHIARIYVDDELQMPIRYESYGWPTREGQDPPLLEEYTYVNVKLNNGFTDRDFDKSNGNYRFN